MAGGALLFLIAQLFILGWAMFVAGRSGLAYAIQVFVILLTSLGCILVIAVGISGVLWFSLVQVLVFLGTGYVISRHHPRNT